MAVYANLSRAQLTYEYLHTNSTTHEFLFGALAELVDNARDANATEIRIYTVPREEFRGGVLLCFLDNGCGMDPVEVSQVIQFGRSSKREAGANHVGQYGNGLKSGSMRIGKDMMVFTKKNSTMSCLFLSRTFHEREDIHEVIVPMPSWNVESKEPHLPEGHTLERHRVEVDIITKYSPFSTLEDLLANFDSISDVSGTNVMIYNLKLMDNGSAELDITKNPKDIIMADPHAGEVYDIHENILPQRISFRSYCELLYCEPRMKIYVQDVIVRTQKLAYCLYKPRSYIYTSNRFKTRSELEAAAAEKAAKNAEERAKELTTQAREANAKCSSTTKEGRHAIQVAVAKADQAKFDADVKKRIAEAKRKSAKEPKTLTFTFGFNIDKRRLDGLFIYNCNRLIRMYEKVGPQTEAGVKCAGIVGVVDVPYLVLEPTHNKQDFADQKEYKHLLKSMAEHMLQYWKDSKVENTGATKFWDDFGYSGQWNDDPSDDVKYKMKRLMSVPSHVQCNKCLKWRQITYTRKMISYDIVSNWTCTLNPDPTYANCSKAEQKINIPVGRLLKEIRNLNEKREEEVRKLQEKLDQKQSELRKRKPKSPSPEPVHESSGRRRRKSPSPDKVRICSPRGRKVRSPPPVKESPVRQVRKKKSPSPPPPPKRRAKSPSPKRGKKAKSISPPPKKSKRVKTLSPSKSMQKEASSNIAKVEKKAKSRSPPPIKRSQPAQSSHRASTRPKSPPQNTKVVKKASKPLPSEKIEKEAIEAHENSESDNTSTGDVALDAQEISNGSVEPNKEVDGGQKKKKDLKGRNESPLLEEPVAEEVITSEIYPIDTKVEAKMHNTWYAGCIVACKKSGENATLRVRVKFEKHPHDKFDKWFYETDPTLRLRDENSELVVSVNNVANDISLNSTSDLEMTDNVKGELLEKVTFLLRRSLCYFRAPDFEKDKKEILSLTPQQLRDFPLTTFFDDYERNIKKQLQATRDNLNRRTEEAENKLRECESQKNKIEKELKETKQLASKHQKTLKELRLGVNVMLRSILNEDEKLDSNDASENVDIYLKTIVDQISESNTT